jgi:hypothetical protein
LRYEENRLSFCAILLAAYFAIAPVHQTLLLSNGSTVNKYFAFAIMILLFLKNRCFTSDLSNLFIPIAAYAVISIIWSGSLGESITSVISLISFLTFALIVSTNKWSNKDKKIILSAYVLASTYYAVMLVVAQNTMRRSTFLGIGGKTADQNVLAINISIAVLILVRFFYASEHLIYRMYSLVLAGVILLGIFATGSRGAIVAASIGMIYIVTKASISSKGKIRTILIGIILLCFILYVMGGNTKLGQIVMERMFSSASYQDAGTNRFNIWKAHLTILMHRPWGLLMGFGFGGENAAYRSYYGTSWSQATHQDILNMICYGGLPLLLLFARPIRYVMRKAKREDNILGYAWMLMAIIAGLSVDYYLTYGWWNALIMAYIGADSAFKSPQIIDYEHENND